LQAIKEKRLNTEKNPPRGGRREPQIKSYHRKLIRIREENAKLKNQIANMEN
jgi:hypothetical protein